MSQNAEKVIDHFELFRGPEYTEMLANKKCMFEDPVPAEELARVSEWTKSGEYRKGMSAAGRSLRRTRIRRNTALCARLSGLHCVLSQPLLAALQGAHSGCFIVHD
jgi:hypothetical protein